MDTFAARSSLMWAVFAVTYAGIALGGFPRLVLDRTGVALLGAIAMLVVGGTTIEQATGHIDYETMLLLFGLMVFSAQLRVAGFYSWTGFRLVRLADRPRLLLLGVIVASAGLSALLANDIVCLALSPLLCDAVLRARRDPLPYLLALATASNIGSGATLIGNPQNMYIGTVASLRFGHFFLTLFPVTVLALGLCYATIVRLCRAQLDERIAAPAIDRKPPVIERDGYLIGKTLVLLFALVICFLAFRGPDAAQLRAIAALAGAGVLLCSRRHQAARLYAHVDWNLILLFLSLFVINGAMTRRGLTAGLFGWLAATGIDPHRPWELALLTTGLSNLVSNVPAVLLLQPSVAAADSEKLWYLLALVSTWAGNLTLVGSLANLIVAEGAAAYGVKLSWRRYGRVGVPLTILTVALGTAWLVWVMG